MTAAALSKHRLGELKLEILNIEYCGYIDSVPIVEVLNLPNLKELACEGCSKLYYPAQEICKQGGKATLRFLQEVNGQVNTRMNLFLIGDSEAGKTSVIMALKSNSNKAYYIRTDHKTVGIDITSWKPKDADIVFDIFDLAGAGCILHNSSDIPALKGCLYFCLAGRQYRAPESSTNYSLLARVFAE